MLSGVAVNGIPGSKDVALAAGSYWFKKRGERGVTKCVSLDECLFRFSQTANYPTSGFEAVACNGRAPMRRERLLRRMER